LIILNILTFTPGGDKYECCLSSTEEEKNKYRFVKGRTVGRVLNNKCRR